MLQRLGGSQTLGGIEHERLLEQIREHLDLPRLRLGDLGGHQLRADVLARQRALLKLDDAYDLPLGHLVALLRQKIVVGIEMQLRESALANELMRHLALHLLDELHHVIVRIALEHDFSGVQLEEGDARRPHVNRTPIIDSHHDLGRAVETRDQIRRYLVVVTAGGGPEIAHLDHVVLVVDDDVVRLQVRMHDVQTLHVAQRGEQLPSVHPDCVHLDATLVAVLAKGHPQILVERLEDHAQVVLVVKRAEELDAMLLALRVVPRELLQVHDLLLARTPHHLVVSLHLDGHLQPGGAAHVDATHDSREDTFAKGAKHLVAVVEYVAHTVRIVALLVIIVVASVHHSGLVHRVLDCRGGLLHVIVEDVEAAVVLLLLRSPLLFPRRFGGGRLLCRGRGRRSTCLGALLLPALLLPPVLEEVGAQLALHFAVVLRQIGARYLLHRHRVVVVRVAVGPTSTLRRVVGATRIHLHVTCGSVGGAWLRRRFCGRTRAGGAGSRRTSRISVQYCAFGRRFRLHLVLCCVSWRRRRRLRLMPRRNLSAAAPALLNQLLLCVLPVELSLLHLLLDALPVLVVLGLLLRGQRLHILLGLLGRGRRAVLRRPCGAPIVAARAILPRRPLAVFGSLPLPPPPPPPGAAPGRPTCGRPPSSRKRGCAS
mmetsp:Transcript_68966/g.189363  ORF Transcript_68966/g.189363 Transcript_68966/m.189363 type:complete len:655 (-) Transcript_68966:682-2646(-)